MLANLGYQPHLINPGFLLGTSFLVSTTAIYGVDFPFSSQKGGEQTRHATADRYKRGCQGRAVLQVSSMARLQRLHEAIEVEVEPLFADP